MRGFRRGWTEWTKWTGWTRSKTPRAVHSVHSVHKVHSPRPVALALALILLLLPTAACTRGHTKRHPPVHLNPNMDHQPKVRAQSASAFFYDGAAMRQPVPGTVARGDLALPATFTTGKTAAGTFLAANPLAGRSDLSTEEILARGEERYGIYCTPCHGARGDGQGMIRQRSGVAAANLLEARIREQPDGQIFDVVTHGLGLMAGYAYQIEPDDRWAIIAWVRDLQANAPVAPSAQPAAQPQAEPGTEAAAQPDAEPAATEGEAS